MWSKIKMLDSKWKTWIAVILIIAIWIAASMVIERIDCAVTTKKADTAYANANFVEAELYYQKLSDKNCPDRDGNDKDRLQELFMYNKLIKLQNELVSVSAYGHTFGNPYEELIGHYQIFLEHYPQGKMRDDIQKRLNEIYQGTGEAGKYVMLEMYKISCSGGEWESNIIPSVDNTIINGNLDPKYWYPEARISESKYIANMPAEFRIAICYKRVQTTDTVETCLYSNSLGAVVDSIVRRNAIYEIELLDLLTHKTIAKYQPMYSLLPEACPQTITSGVSLFDYDEIIGEPDFTTVTSWIDEQIQSLK